MIFRCIRGFCIFNAALVLGLMSLMHAYGSLNAMLSLKERKKIPKKNALHYRWLNLRDYFQFRPIYIQNNCPSTFLFTYMRQIGKNQFIEQTILDIPSEIKPCCNALCTVFCT